MSAAGGAPTVQAVERTLAILDVVAERGGASAREVSDVLGYPLPTTYRLLRVLTRGRYLVHLRRERRFELGDELDRLGTCLHRQVGVPAAVRGLLGELHERAAAPALLAVRRGDDVVVAHVEDCTAHPCPPPLRFGFHEAAHATAFGRVLLAAMGPHEAEGFLQRHGTAPWTAATRCARGPLQRELASVAASGVAVEHGELIADRTSVAAGVRDRAGQVVSAVALVLERGRTTSAREREAERLVRVTATEVARHHRRRRSP
ncbi:IclR family transcriptional regulator [Kineococcus esterisolvens]|uniref:IclR family transcriptional regulator n=1 Tax=unclassified Kineococcus TaxID=2621656 RepID=UPI003D7C5DE9